MLSRIDRNAKQHELLNNQCTKKGMAELNITQGDVKLPQPEEYKRESCSKCKTLLVSKTHVQFLKGRENTQRPFYRRSNFEQNMFARLTNGKLNKTRFINLQHSNTFAPNTRV